MAPLTGAEAPRSPFNRYTCHVRASYFDETAETVKQVTSVRIKAIGVYNVSFVGTKALAAARGVVISQMMPDPVSPATPLSGEYLAAGKAVAGDKFEPNYSSIEGYVAAKTLVEGLMCAGSSPRVEGLIACLESLRDLDLDGFFVDFSAQKHTGSKFVDLSMLTADGTVRR